VRQTGREEGQDHSYTHFQNAELVDSAVSTVFDVIIGREAFFRGYAIEGEPRTRFEVTDKEIGGVAPAQASILYFDALMQSLYF
jgi:hypothetical protein